MLCLGMVRRSQFVNHAGDDEGLVWDARKTPLNQHTKRSISIKTYFSWLIVKGYVHVIADTGNFDVM